MFCASIWINMKLALTGKHEGIDNISQGYFVVPGSDISR